MKAEKLTRKSMAEAVSRLAERDPDLGRIVDAYGHPPLRGRKPGFATLAMLIIEQQVSLASAKATFERLLEHTGNLIPERVAALDDPTLRALGLSRQKARYLRRLAEAILDGSFVPEALARMSDEEARVALIALDGVGAWTAEVYLLTVMRRPDAWPTGDRALVVAAREVKRLKRDPSAAELEQLGESWRPYRAVAARLLWLHYRHAKRQRLEAGG